MTKVKDNPMDESGKQSRVTEAAKPDPKKKSKSSMTDEKNASGKTDASAFDAKSNNMSQKR
jgi:hypothetical protein